jgi:hypothetical protein
VCPLRDGRIDVLLKCLNIRQLSLSELSSCHESPCISCDYRYIIVMHRTGLPNRPDFLLLLDRRSVHVASVRRLLPELSSGLFGSLAMSSIDGIMISRAHLESSGSSSARSVSWSLGARTSGYT